MSASDTNTIRTVFAFDARDVNPSEPTAVANCIRVVQELVGIMIRDHGVPTEHIYLVGSSGLAEAPTRSRLRDEAANTLGRTLTYVTVKDEAHFMFKGLVPPGDLTEVAVIDVGGGNSKAVYFKSQDGKGFVDTVRLCDGVRALSKKADPIKPETQYRQELLAIKEHEIVPNINQTVIDHPAFATRPILYLSGGISWVMASSLAPPDTKLGAGNDKVELKAEQIAAWLKKTQAAPRFAYEYPGEKVRSAGAQIAKDNRASVESNFGPAQISSGVVILQALQETLNFSARRRIIFCRDSLYAWPRAYLDEQLSKRQK